MAERMKLAATPIHTLVNAKTRKQIALLTKGGRSEKEITDIAKNFVLYWNSHDDLLEAVKVLMVLCKEAYKKGYAEGYERGIEPDRDESCVKETTIFKNDFARAWDKSETKAAIAVDCEDYVYDGKTKKDSSPKAKENK